MSEITEKEWVEDFSEFVRSEGAQVPSEVSSAILSQVRHDLNPSAWTIFFKLLSVHSVIGTFSLAICSQFGINPFQTDFSLSDYFMKFGHSACMVLCGVLFVSFSILSTLILVRPEEVRVLRANAWLEVFGLSMISLGTFAAVGAEITMALGLLWLLGAMLGGAAVILIPSRSFRQGTT